MNTLEIGLLAGGLLMAMSATLVFIWGVRTGQFDNLEETKYQMFHEEDDDGAFTHRS